MWVQPPERTRANMKPAKLSKHTQTKWSTRAPSVTNSCPERVSTQVSLVRISRCSIQLSGPRGCRLIRWVELMGPRRAYRPPKLLFNSKREKWVKEMQVLWIRISERAVTDRSSIISWRLCRISMANHIHLFSTRRTILKCLREWIKMQLLQQVRVPSITTSSSKISQLSCKEVHRAS